MISEKRCKPINVSRNPKVNSKVLICDRTIYLLWFCKECDIINSNYWKLLEQWWQSHYKSKNNNWNVPFKPSSITPIHCHFMLCFYWNMFAANIIFNHSNYNHFLMDLLLIQRITSVYRIINYFELTSSNIKCFTNVIIKYG